MDVGHWLRNIGFEKYESVFIENAIDDDVLEHLDGVVAQRFEIHRSASRPARLCERHPMIGSVFPSMKSARRTIPSGML